MSEPIQQNQGGKEEPESRQKSADQQNGQGENLPEKNNSNQSPTAPLTSFSQGATQYGKW